ncbi:hypothetical protein DFJ73DRAFT_961485 [Zopfochytrium polystomum]|nr:hypothetical protein DFJ73DRAFT_961485 [Zopfochytrium polystomum]
MFHIPRQSLPLSLSHHPLTIPHHRPHPTSHASPRPRRVAFTESSPSSSSSPPLSSSSHGAGDWSPQETLPSRALSPSLVPFKEEIKSSGSSGSPIINTSTRKAPAKEGKSCEGYIRTIRDRAELLKATGNEIDDDADVLTRIAKWLNDGQVSEDEMKDIALELDIAGVPVVISQQTTHSRTDPVLNWTPFAASTTTTTTPRRRHRLRLAAVFSPPPTRTGCPCWMPECGKPARPPHLLETDLETPDGQFVLPKGTVVQLNLDAHHRDPGLLGLNACEYLPDRFLCVGSDGAVESAVLAPFQYAVFGGQEPRLPGKKIGMSIMKTGLAALSKFSRDAQIFNFSQTVFARRPRAKPQNDHGLKFQTRQTAPGGCTSATACSTKLNSQRIIFVVEAI